MLLDPPVESDDSPVATVESGSKLPPLSIVALDAGGNRTAPSQNEDWQVWWVKLFRVYRVVSR